jgi:hypothetical protein
MADLSVTPVAAGIKPVQGMSLGDMINVARGAQAYQQAEQINPLALQQQQQAARTGQIQLGVVEQSDKERQNMQKFFADPNNFQTDGRIDLDKINAAVPAIAPLTGADYISKYSTLSTAQTEGLKAKQNLTQEQRQLVASTLGLLGRAGVNDPKIINSELQNLVLQNPNNSDLKNLVEKSYIPVFSQMPSGPQLPDALIKASQAILTPTQQQTSFAPQAGTISTGEQIFPTVTTPAVGGMLPRIQMGAQPLADIGLPPTTEVIDPATGQKRLLGPASQRGGAPLTTGLGPAQTSLLTAGGATIGTDLQTTVKEAADAPSRVAIFQNIKKFAPDSFTGVGGQRKELAAGILNAVGIPAYEQEKVNTEELAKNSALLALAGGNTDAARALAEIATPNKKLNEKAILAIADQMIGIENMKIARGNYLTPVQNDATQYGQRKLQFDQIADPRIFQEMTAQDVAKLKASMSAAEQAELTRKIRLARQMGIVR